MSHPYDAGLIAQRTKEREATLHERINSRLEISRAMAGLRDKPNGEYTEEEWQIVKAQMEAGNERVRREWGCPRKEV